MAKKDKSSTADSTKSLVELDTVSPPVFEKGPEREYLSSDIPESVTKSRTVSSKEYLFLSILFVVGLFVRLNKLEQPNSVVFDEVHFGGFAKKYVLRKFFMDVHPPLAKMLFAAVAWLGGFKGDFDFEKIGDVYPSTVPYVLMRAWPAVLGLATVFLCYLTLRSSGVRPAVAFVTAGLLLVENSFVTISRFILLDSPLIFFIAAAVYAFKRFEAQQAFSDKWFRSLFFCAIALGLALSSKWVGLFTVAWVGILCLGHMWLVIGDLKVPPATVLKHAVYRASFLLVIPALVYMWMFLIHFSVLSKEGDGSPFMTSAFRSDLEGTTVPKRTTAQIGYGSVVTINHVNTRGGYLHSHNHMYPGGSQQQQITLYPHLDSNNEWLIEPYNMSIPNEFVQLKHGDKVRFKHLNTHRRLHSHDEKPPVSERDWQKEVSCYGFEGFEGDANDDWIFEIVEHASTGKGKEEVRAIETVFRLRHAMTGMHLFSTSTKLPSWGFEQQEVTAASQGSRPLSYWYIETNKANTLPRKDRETISYPKLSFWQKFVESHKVMWMINQGLTSHHHWQSSPHDWPLLMRGISYWGKDQTSVYFLGNPLVWWVASGNLLAFLIHVLTSIVKWQSGRSVAKSKHLFHFNMQMFSYFLGWAIHYFPFFIMGRQLFLHHYLPAQYFAILGLGHIFELIVACVSGKFGVHFLFIFLVAASIVHLAFSPLINGSQWTKAKCLSTKIVKGWDYTCELYPDTYEGYNSIVKESASPTEFQTARTIVVTDINDVPEYARQQAMDQLHLKEEEFEEPPPAETHYGELPDFLKDAEAPEDDDDTSYHQRIVENVA